MRDVAHWRLMVSKPASGWVSDQDDERVGFEAVGIPKTGYESDQTNLNPKIETQVIHKWYDVRL